MDRDCTSDDRLAWVGADEPAELASLVALTSLAGMSPRRLWAMLATDGPVEAWRRVLAGRVPPSGRSRDPSPSWQAQAASTRPDELLARHHACGIRVHRYGAPSYPVRLVDDVDPPAVLFSQGLQWAGDEVAVAVVGTRRCTPYGRSVAHDLGVALAERHIDVVSGLAHGIDAAAHSGARSARTAGCVAVVANGLDTIYPRGNRKLWQAITVGGTLLSEWPLGVAATPWRFPARNRIIAALATVTVVVESAASGGSMHTVDEAVRRDRPVFAVPGSIRSPVSAGTNRLIADGAHVLGSIDDFVSTLAPATSAQGRLAIDTEQAATDPTSWLLDAIGWEPAALDDVIDTSGRAVDEVLLDVERLIAAGSVERHGATIRRLR